MMRLWPRHVRSRMTLWYVLVLGFLLLAYAGGASLYLFYSLRPAKSALDTARIAKIVGHEGEQNGAVYKITVGRADLDVKEMGATINARMGLNTWAAFVGTDEDAAVAGDVAMVESEVTPTLKALRGHGLEVVAIHHHMTNSRPLVIFLHYWGRGPADKLATGFMAALDELGKGNKQ